MSRIGKSPIEIPSGVEVKVSGNRVDIKGSLGSLGWNVPEPIKVRLDGAKLIVDRPDDTKKSKSLHGLSRSLLANMVEGVTKGFEKKLELHGVGYRANLKGDTITFSLGHSHPIIVKAPGGISFEVNKKLTEVTVKGIEKQLVGQLAADIRQLRKVEPYKGKGIRYKGEHVIRKAGKTVAAGK